MEEQQNTVESKSGGGFMKYRKVYIRVIVIVLVFLVGFQLGGGTFLSSGKRDGGLVETGRDGAPQVVDWQLLWDVIDAINEKYVDRPIDAQKVLYGAARGAAASLGDPYTVFLPPADAQEFQDELNGNFEGIGAEIAIRNEQLTVVAPLEGSPAERAGLKAGDAILKVDGEDTAGITIQDAVNKIRGEAGTSVTLTVLRKGENATRDISITRGQIVVKSIESEVREANGKRIGYIKMRRFGDDTPGALDNIVSDFLVAGVDGVILDMRNNPGGFLEAAVDIAGNWVRDGDTVVIQHFGDDTEDVFRAEGQARLADIPTVVLINGGSASASEIVAGALQDHNKATLVGEQSFGKGSVQELIDIGYGADLKLTIAKWLTPSGHDLNKEGLTPDEVIELTEEDFNADRDPQLDRAMQILSE